MYDLQHHRLHIDPYRTVHLFIYYITSQHNTSYHIISCDLASYFVARDINFISFHFNDLNLTDTPKDGGGVCAVASMAAMVMPLSYTSVYNDITR